MSTERLQGSAASVTQGMLKNLRCFGVGAKVVLKCTLLMGNPAPPSNSQEFSLEPLGVAKFHPSTVCHQFEMNKKTKTRG